MARRKKTAASQVQATGTPAPVPTAPPPEIIEQVVYRDEYVVVPSPSDGNPASEPAHAPAVELAPAESEDGHESEGVVQSEAHDDDEVEHDDRD